MGLTKSQIGRYSRHLIMPEVGVKGQEKLADSKVLCIGAGGLGSPLALYLASAGIGTIGIVDFDVVDLSNLQRQILHAEDRVGELKVESAKKRLLELNSDINVNTYNLRLTSDNALDLFKDYDVIVDGTDNFATRYLVNDACVLLNKPNVYGSIFRFEGQATVFNYKGGPHYRDLYPEPPPPGMVPSCAEGGVLGILPGIIGVIQATETVKILLDAGTTLSGRLLLYDSLQMSFREIKLRKSPDTPKITELIDYEEFCGMNTSEDNQGEVEINVEDLKQIVESKQKITLLDVREPGEYEICNLDNSTLIPLGDLTSRVHELDTADDIIVYCHHGMRSLQATRILKGMGYSKVRNLAGGIDAWAAKFDDKMPRY
ncbi:MAG: molybdopterin-synthase adenylyltransferase MoeB [Thermodesulfobacteriota bacterium]|nr:molybdopterin-synthase adenylyltransferase MoeB [Thermodesulfobacteriota bacterium]|tara:strand:- start:1269 stop:2387 length:1119 start_codon:yes stop_codon:yes gene_type:complete